MEFFKLLVPIRVLALQKVPLVFWEMLTGGAELQAMVGMEFGSAEW